MPRHARPVGLPLTLEHSDAPLRHRIADSVIALLSSGHLRPGDTLPASRALAAELSVSRNAVLAAYDELAAAGFIHAAAGASTVVSQGADLAARAGVASHVAQRLPAPDSRPAMPAAPRWNLLPGYPDTALISTAAWRAAWRAAAAEPVGNGLPWSDNTEALQEALAVHLRRTRGVTAAPAEIILAPGVSAALRALAAAAGLAGRPVAFEEPGYPEGRQALAQSGALIRPVPVDGDGLDPAALADGDAAVYTTPAHQYPLGARLSAPRRATLIRWARQAGALVIEDDFDGEFRYDVRGLPALHSLGRGGPGGRFPPVGRGGPGGRFPPEDGQDVVAYVGTASKILSPGLRIAWVVAPPHLRGPLREALGACDESVSIPAAQAVAHFISSGSLTRHLARAARTYAARRHALITALAAAAPALAVSGVDAGLHLVAGLPAGTGERALRDRLAQAGLAVNVLSDYTTVSNTREALVCGYALLPETQAAAAAAVIAAQLAGRG
ncbi:MAG TPA: PLP-dependent aminotransferase family protein [Streptosporangiaceae bacterium]|nr:PLP-dependent aminotransferase family protein [Streptosporangiaceae bacterium]